MASGSSLILTSTPVKTHIAACGVHRKCIARAQLAAAEVSPAHGPHGPQGETVLKAISSTSDFGETSSITYASTEVAVHTIGFRATAQTRCPKRTSPNQSLLDVVKM